MQVSASLHLIYCELAAEILATPYLEHSTSGDSHWHIAERSAAREHLDRACGHQRQE